MTNNRSTDWNAEQSAELYRIRDWGAGYFDLSSEGEVTISAPCGDQRATVKLNDIIRGIRERGYDTPVQLRIENLLEDRITQLNESFARAIADNGYNAQYRGVFPIKVNQQAYVIEQIARVGERYHHGLEAGSKPELMIALAETRGTDSIIVCNGYKDRDFIDLGLRANQLGVRCFFVAETLDEIALIIERSRKLGVEPNIGFRIKLSTKVKGHWEADSGERSIFGLSIIQVMEGVKLLKRENMLHCLKMLHCHLGSQLPDIDNICEGVREACRYYTDLVGEGAPMGWMDMGGGLAVDYDGSNSTGGYSKNYSVDEYCQSIVRTTREMLDPEGIAHPMLVTESGRATVAYSSILLFNILDVSHFDPMALPASLPDDVHSQVAALFVCAERLSEENIEQSYSSAIELRQRVRDLFATGDIRLAELAMAENIYYGLMQRIAAMAEGLEADGKEISEHLANLRQARADIYYGNFSLFQSLPDNWALQQLFPVMPLSRLDEKPNREAVIADITCDCDGKMDRFIGRDGGPSKTLPLHEFNHGDDYCIGVFLVGAYQETLGSLHNLFGDNHAISVRINADGSFDLAHEIEADDADEVLRTVEYESLYLFNSFRNRAEKAVQDGRIAPADRRQILADYSRCLSGNTYFER
ncbi:biosynthetic arginine decarboxylase [Porticoccaceae bacterium LTM1]|nr:biosynthetic arginine decarboxylase [Porticoccaceae bacterium LTM1]